MSFRIPGQVPGKTLLLSATPRLSPDVEKMLSTQPPGITLDSMTDRPVLRAQDAVRNLGLTKALESDLSLRIHKEAITATNQLAFQKAIHSTMRETGIPPEVQSVIGARAQKFFRTVLQKAGVQQVYTLGQLSELKKGKIAHPPAPGALLLPSSEMKAEENKRKKKVQKEMGVEAPKMEKSRFVLSKAFEETGGKFVAKVKKEGKTKYYYDEEKYKKEHGEHSTGEEARARHIHSSVHKCTEKGGDQGCDVTAYGDLVKKFGAKHIHDSVKRHVEEGTIHFKKGRFHAKKKAGEK